MGAIYEQGNFTDVNLDRQVQVNGIPLATGDDAQIWMLVGQYAFGNNVLRAAYGQTDTGIDGEDTIDNYHGYPPSVEGSRGEGAKVRRECIHFTGYQSWRKQSVWANC